MFTGGQKEFTQIPKVASGLEGTESSDVQLASKSYVDSILTGRELVAWVNFNGTSTVAIRASYNVSSITDNGTGDYTVNFATALPDTDYCVSGYNSFLNNSVASTQVRGIGNCVKAAGSFRFQAAYISSTNGGATKEDTVEINLMISR